MRDTPSAVVCCSSTSFQLKHPGLATGSSWLRPRLVVQDLLSPEEAPGLHSGKNFLCISIFGVTGHLSEVTFSSGKRDLPLLRLAAWFSRNEVDLDRHEGQSERILVPKVRTAITDCYDAVLWRSCTLLGGFTKPTSSVKVRTLLWGKRPEWVWIRRRGL